MKVDSALTGSNYLRIRERKRRRACLGFCWKWYDNATTFSTHNDYHSIMHYPEGSGITLRNGMDWIVYEHNNREWGDENGNTWFSPWDIYSIKRLYGISPNPKPDFTPTPAYPSEVVDG